MIGDVPYPINYLHFPKEIIINLENGLKTGSIFVEKSGEDYGKYKKDGIYYSSLGNLVVVSVQEKETDGLTRTEIIELKKAW